MSQENPLFKKYGIQQGAPQPAPNVIVSPPRPVDPLRVNADVRDDRRLGIAEDTAARVAESQQNSQANEAERIRLAQEAAERAEKTEQRQQRQAARIPLADADKLSENISIFSGFDRTLNTFQDDFGGNLLGAAENLGESYFGVGTPGQAQWWADFRATDNQIRNELFGATLTPAEQAAYAATSINPAMRPSEIRVNLKRRRDIVQGGLKRRREFLIASGYDPNAVDILFRPVLGGEGAQPADQNAQSPAASSEQAASPIGAPDTQTETRIMSGFEQSAQEGTNDENALFFKQAYGHSFEQDRAFTQWLNSNVGQPLTPEQIEAKKQEFGIRAGWDDSATLANRHQEVGRPDEKGFVRNVNWGGNPLSSGREKALSQMAADDPRGQADTGDIAAQGFTFGLSDEAAGVGAGIGSVLKGEGFSDAYTTARAYENDRLNKARERGGALGTAAEVLGGVASGGIGSSVIGAGRGAGNAVYQGARAGALGGGVAGFGYSEPGQRFEGTVGGAVAGGALGGAIPAAMKAARPTYNALNRALGRDKDIPINQVRNALAADGNTPQSAGRRVQEAQKRGVPMSLGDTGENTRGLLGSVTRQRGPSRTIGMETIVARQEEQFERISTAVRRDLGPTANIRETGEALMDRAKAEAGPLYEAFENAPGAGAVFPKIEPLLQRPSMKKALERARRIAAEEGEDPTALGFDLDGQGEVVLTRVPSWKTLDYAKRGLDDVVESYRDRTTGKLVLDTEGRAVNGTLRQLLSIADKANPTYAAARSAYAGPARMRDALEKGAKALNKSPDDIAAEIKGLGAAEREMYRLGVRKNITELLGSKGDYADKAATISRTPKVRAALVKVFGSGKKVDNFFKTLDDERTLYQTYKEVATGSPTASRMAFDATIGDSTIAQEAMDVANSAKQGGIFAAVGNVLLKVREAGQLGAGKAGDAARESIAALLTEADPAELVLIQQAARRAAAKQKLLERKEVVKARRQGYASGVGAVTTSENLGAK